MMKVMGKELFKLVREKYGAKLKSVIQEKVSVLSGDITRDWMGLESSTLEKLFGEVNVVINLAANTNFDERYILINYYFFFFSTFIFLGTITFLSNSPYS